MKIPNQVLVKHRRTIPLGPDVRSALVGVGFRLYIHFFHILTLPIHHLIIRNSAIGWSSKTLRKARVLFSETVDDDVLKGAWEGIKKRSLYADIVEIGGSEPTL